MEILCFCAGVMFFYTKSIHLLCFLLIALVFRPKISLLIWFVAAIAWSAFHQILCADKSMPDTPLIQHAVLEGHIASIPKISPHQTQFEFSVMLLDHKPVKAKVLLSCYQHCPKVRAGEYWQLNVKLKKPRDLSNPGGFAYVKGLDARHIHFTGYLKQGSTQLEDPTPSHDNLLKLRAKLADRLASNHQNQTTLGILQALTLGVTARIDKHDWDLFRRTGTTHLMVISGAHIGLVAGLTYALISFLWSFSARLCLHCPAQKAASLFGFFMALLYALLAGLGVPAQRALIGCFFMSLRYFMPHKISVWQAWRYALFVVLLFEPHAVMMPGFYLSFTAVAVLVFIHQRFAFSGLRNLIVMQLACLIGLMPLTLFWFSYAAVNGLIANVLAIPWVSFIIVPFGLLMTLTPLSEFPVFSHLLNDAILCLLTYLKWVDSLAWINVSYPLTDLFSVLTLMIAITAFVCLPNIRIIPALVIAIFAALMPGHEKIKTATFRLDLLDVGQGLAVVVRTHEHILIYDTGMQFYKGSDMGQLAIAPYLQTLGTQFLDKVIISHPDLDHRGGLNSLASRYRIRELIVDSPDYYKQGVRCHEHPDWRWDGVLFHFFALPTRIASKNNTSCVLRISNKAGSVLLTGDIEKPAEQYLAKTYQSQLASNILVVPHHGSKTSSSSDFINQVAPRYALMSYGFDNRYHFPHPEVMQRYHQKQIPVYNTVDCGMISVIFNSNVKLKCYIDHIANKY
jgi:competence protein ComEC